MKVIIPAAGMGSRMRPLTEQKPKCLIDIAGKSFIDRQIEVLHQCGFDDITLVGGYKFSMIKEHLKDKVNYAFNPFYETTNSVVSVWLATLNMEDDDILIINSDVIFDKDLIIEMTKDKTNINVAVSTQWSEERGYKAQIQNGLIVDMSMDIEHDKIGGEYAGMIFINKNSMQKLKKQCEILMEEKKFNIWFEDMVVDLIKSGTLAKVTEVNPDKWYEIDNVEELEYARNKFGR